jgi:hypothetical protein
MANITPYRERDHIAIPSDLGAILERIRRVPVAADTSKAQWVIVEYALLGEHLAKLQNGKPADADEEKTSSIQSSRTATAAPEATVNA